MVDKPESRQTKKTPKTPEFIDTDSNDSDNEQELTSEQLKKPPKTPEFVDTDSDDSDNEQEPAVKCIVMYSTEDEQELQKIPDPSPAKIPRYCTHILTKGVRKDEQCRFRASNETGKCHHHKNI